MNHSPIKRMAGKAVALAFAAGVFGTAGAVSAQASTWTGAHPSGRTAPAGATAHTTTPAPAALAAQAKGAGLSSAQARTLQTRVDRYVADYHGTQIAANKIAANGMYITLALPGEKYARDLPAASGVRPADVWQDRCLDGSPVYSGWFCLYKGETFQGDVLSMYTCGNHSIYGWYGNGSWVNDQTRGTVALLRSANWSYAYYTPGAYASSYSFNWTPVDVVHPC
jgi:hypothetical protein